MANLSDITYLSHGLELAARLRDVAFNVDDDNTFKQQLKGELVYYVDPQIIDVLVDPIHNLIDVELFGRSIEDTNKSEIFLGASRMGLHLSIATLIFTTLVGDPPFGQFNQKILLHPQYDDEVKSAILFYKRAAYTTRGPKAARPDPLPSTDQLKKNTRAIRAAIDTYRSDKTKIIDAYVSILENISGILCYAVAPKEAPLARFQDLITCGLFSTGREWLNKIKSDQELRASPLYETLYDKILRAKEHLMQLEHDARSESALRLAASRDALAISSALELNRYMLENNCSARALFLTADATLLNLLSSSQNREKILADIFPTQLQFNFVRSPIELPGLFLKQSAGKEEDLLQRIRYFDNFLDPSKSDRERRHRLEDVDYQGYINAIRFHERGVETPALNEMASLPPDIVKGVEYNLRYVLRDLEAAIAGLKDVVPFIDMVEQRLTELVPYKEDISRIVEEGWNAADGFADSISQSVGISLFYEANSRLRRELRAALDSVISDTQAIGPYGGAIIPLPWLDFSRDQVEYFKGLAEKGSPTASVAEIFPEFNLDKRGEVTLANAFLCAVVGDWRKAEHFAHEAVAHFTVLEGGGGRISEAEYFRAVAARNSPVPMPERWSDAAAQLKSVVERDKFQGDPRYVVEYATLGVSVPYHIYHYGPQYDVVPRPSPTEALTMLQWAHHVFKDKYPVDTELSDRLAIQLYTDLCLIYIFTVMIKPKMQTSITVEETQIYLTSLEASINRKIDQQRPNYWTLIHKAVSLDLSNSDASTKNRQFQMFAGHFGETHRYITEYNRHKLVDLREYFQSKAA